MEYTLKLLSGTIGAEIQGIDLTKPFTNEAKQAIRLRANLFEPSVYQKAMASLNESHDYELVTKWITNFIWPQ